MNCTKDCFNCEYGDCIKPESFSLVKSLNNKRYYQRHKEKENARSTEYAKTHREQINARRRKIYNKEQRHEAYLRLKARQLQEVSKCE